MKNFREMKIASWVFVVVTLMVLWLYSSLFREQYFWLTQLEFKLDILDQKIHSCLNQIPGPAELQRRLNRAEPERPIKVDGRPGPETIAKWQRVFCNQSAAATFLKVKNQKLKGESMTPN